jgi:prepilin-type N-terminal cleavage/methylation domain-containing protein
MKAARLHSFLSNVKSNQRGFTLIELIIAIAIVAFVTGGVVTALFQVFNVNKLNSDHLAATRQVQNAGFWISQVSQMAPIVLTDDDIGTVENEILILSWAGWGYDIGDDRGTDYVEIGYYYDAATSEIWRNEVKTTNTYNDAGQLIDTTISSSLFHVAQFITSATTTLSGSQIGVTIVAEVADASEQRTYEVSPRPIG